MVIHIPLALAVVCAGVILFLLLYLVYTRRWLRRELAQIDGQADALLKTLEQAKATLDGYLKAGESPQSLGARTVIRARLSDGRFLFGINAGNVKRLQAGQPLVIDLTQLGGTDRLMIMYAATLDDLLKELDEAAGPLPEPTPNPTPETPQ